MHTTALISLRWDVRCMKVNAQVHHVPIPRLNNGYYGGLDKLIAQHFSLIEGHHKQHTEPVTICNTPCTHFSHNGVATCNCIAIAYMNKQLICWLWMFLIVVGCPKVLLSQRPVVCMPVQLLPYTSWLINKDNCYALKHGSGSIMCILAVQSFIIHLYAYVHCSGSPPWCYIASV